MKVIDVNNVHQALPEGCRQVTLFGVPRETRNGKVLQLPGPLTTCYHKPNERVLFWAERDANPFFHFFECLWMVYGRRDVEWIERYNSKIGQFSDDGKTFNGAYGHRWRWNFGIDQLKVIVDQLRKNPDCRRQVLTMWSPTDLPKTDSKDVPCNTAAYFQRNADGQLDIMVMNRSNDLIWGAYGANAVHFSFLLELIATWTRMPVGRYYQVSMNTHVYQGHFELAYRLRQHAPELPNGRHTDHDPYSQHLVVPFPVCSVASEDQWLTDLDIFINGRTALYNDPFFTDVVVPLAKGWDIFKAKKDTLGRIAEATAAVAKCAAQDWKKAATEWLQRRS